ncbi:MAG: glycosyltransferase [Verrucomicrobia bacterium]|nr:glycosyltransferase [Verrucomicrobiota bacterium]
MDVTKPEPILSIICPSKNLGNYLQATLDSIYQQDFQNYEIIVVDGGSTDDTVDILKRNQAREARLRFISEPDSGVLEALWKGLKMARGRYVIQTFVSDGFLYKGWFRECCEVLDTLPDVALVWGLRQRMTRADELTHISFEQFHQTDPPQGGEFFFYWMKTGFVLPEPNYCLRREVMERIMPPPDLMSSLCHYALLANFFTQGYQPYFLRHVANYCRQHAGQLGEQENFNGQKRAALNYYKHRRRSYCDLLIAANRPHVFRDGGGRPTTEVKLPGARLPAVLRSTLRAAMTPEIVLRSTLVFEQLRHRVKHLFRRD